MMPDFSVTFQGFEPVLCSIDHSDLGQRYLQLLRDQVREDPAAVFRDPQSYDLSRWSVLIDRAETELGWHWRRDHYDLAVTTALHKDIEAYLARGYENIPEQHDELLHELHFCLHAIESGSKRNSWLQIEWFNDRGFAITADEYPRSPVLRFGDLRLQNPYVGHHPLFVYEQGDTANVEQTCRFHDWVKPGINIVVNQKVSAEIDLDRYQSWWITHAPGFVAQHGLDCLMAWTGHPVIGRVINLDVLGAVCASERLTLQSINIL